MMAKEKLDSLLLRARDSFDVECISPPPLLAALPHPSPGYILLLLDKKKCQFSKQTTESVPARTLSGETVAPVPSVCFDQKTNPKT